MKEIWKPIPEYEGLYSASNIGRIKSEQTTVRRSNGRLFNKKEKILRLCYTVNGYYSVNLSKEGKRKTRFVHRLVLQAFLPNKENKPHVNHKDGNKINNNVANLEWCTPRENTLHARDYGLQGFILNHTSAKAIRVLYENGFKYLEIASMFSISKSTVYSVIKNKRWFK